MDIDGTMIEQAKLAQLKRIADALEEGVRLLRPREPDFSSIYDQVAAILAKPSPAQRD